jgi:DNA adenine methylase
MTPPPTTTRTPRRPPAPTTAALRLAVVPTALAHIETTPRPIQGQPRPVEHPLATGRYQTPLRYPGAKTGLADLIGTLIDAARTSPQIPAVDLLVEPFAGGASTSLRLVGAGIVERILLADADPLVAGFWQVAASQPEDLIDRMVDEHARYVAPGGQRALDRWQHWRRWSPPVGMTESTARFEAAMKCLFLNRTTFSGILHGRAGPIGGQSQTSKHDIGCRFNTESLAERIRYVGDLYDTGRLVDVWCKDWKDTLADVPEWYADLIPDRVVAYLDPPYLEKSNKLYQTSFDPHGGYAPAPVDDLHWSDKLLHHRLAEYLRTAMRFRWVLSYDANLALTQDPGLYAAARMTPAKDAKTLLGVKEWRISKRLVSLRYTASARKGRGPADELLITTLPPSSVPTGDAYRPLSTGAGL